MSLRALPLLVVSFILYNAIVFFGHDAAATLTSSVLKLPLPSGATWAMTLGDVVMLVTLVVLFIELLKATYTSTASLVDHGLSMLVFVACLVEFIVAQKAATSVFFFILIAALIDVVAGFTIGIRVARRDLSIGGNA
jgi:hypothetical protein